MDAKPGTYRWIKHWHSDMWEVARIDLPPPTYQPDPQTNPSGLWAYPEGGECGAIDLDQIGPETALPDELREQLDDLTRSCQEWRPHQDTP